MERGAERQREGDKEVVEVKAAVERQWGDAEVLALMTVWDQVGAQHTAEHRTTFELISERLRRLSVVRSWWECQAKCSSLGLQSRKTEEAGTSANYSPGVDGRPAQGWEEGEEVVGNHRGIFSPSVTIPMQEGNCRLNTDCGADADYSVTMTMLNTFEQITDHRKHINLL